MEISPNLLEYSGDLTQPISRTVRLVNNSDKAIAYKVKTTAPRLYVVRPNAAAVPAGSSVEVVITLQGLSENPAPGFKCKDKFLIQTVEVTPELSALTAQVFWEVVTGNPHHKANVKDFKIRVAYNPSLSAADISLDEQNDTVFDTPVKSKATDSSKAEQAETSNEENNPRSSSISQTSATAKAVTAEITATNTDTKKPSKPEFKSASTALASAPQRGGISARLAVLMCVLSFLIAWFFF
ncbi:hypothetical protein CANCADRAFT_87380 [Tortispora caseinolytica NRRL Y-17796]|uniref:MSP domain-containing protein n=1 Tax=Tortispora caseinolytica NRRL Y-17796 TaxID=767744 RepID=A0A1E4TL77_9ASCO|nr:hypothetical protein CANCADRAFT_87380 [Tortispora caseinolytica NRRL Y-17796]